MMLSFLLAAVGCGFAALCYSELASMVPVAGSAYTYAYATLGELLAWVIGWDLVLEYAIGSAAVANGWSNYFVELLGQLFHVHLDPRLIASPWDYDVKGGFFFLNTIELATGERTIAWFNLPAVLITAAITAVLVVGHPRERGVQRGDGPAQRRRSSSRSSAWARPTSTPATGGPSSTSRKGGRAWPRGPRGSSSLTSASTRSRRTPRRPATPSATWRSASSARS